MNNNIIFSPTENAPYVILRNTKINHNGTSEIIFQIKFAPVNLIEKHDYNMTAKTDILTLQPEMQKMD